MKQEGIEAFKQKKYKLSIIYFKQSLKNIPNDPEALIYLNNAVAMVPSQRDKLPNQAKTNLKPCNITDSKPLRIAVVAPSFRNTNQINEEILRGVAQAQNETNLNCGIRNRLLQIVIADDEDEVPKSSEVAKKLVEKKDILAVVGHYSSGATAEAGEVYKKNQTVVISPSSTAVRKSRDKDYGMNLNKYIFRTSTNDEIAVKSLVNHIVKLGRKKAAIVYGSDSTVYSQNFYNELRHQLKSKKVELFDFDECNLFNNANLDKCVETAKDTVNVLVLIPTSKSFEKALEILDSNKDLNLTLLGGDSMYRERVKEKAKNIVVAIPWFQNETNQSQFESNAHELWNDAIKSTGVLQCHMMRLW